MQIYTCRARADAAYAYEWGIVAPEAILLNARGDQVDRHYAGPSWEGNDGSKVMDTVRV